MDAKEARKFTMSNPPVDIEAERRPSLLGRLFRRMSSTETPTMMPNTPTGVGETGQRRESIADQFLKMDPGTTKQPASNDPVFSLFT